MLLPNKKKSQKVFLQCTYKMVMMMMMMMMAMIVMMTMILVMASLFSIAGNNHKNVAVKTYFISLTLRTSH